MKGHRRDFFENLIIYIVLVVLLLGIYYLFFTSNIKSNINFSSYYSSISKEIYSLWNNTRFGKDVQKEENVTVINLDMIEPVTKTNVSYLKYDDNSKKEENIIDSNKTMEKEKEKEILKEKIIINKEIKKK